VLLYGLLGTGKAILVKAIAEELGAVFINSRISDFMTKWLVIL
jgi:ATP-dependent 26S proteasome regulatory subunit